jgi:Family of unknown function (DUF6152)
MRLTLCLATICALACVMPIGAHHSHGNYTDGTIDIQGVVTQVVLVVPHSYVYIDVKKGGATETWVLEATSRQGLERIGVTRDYLKPGDAIKARCHQLRDGSNGCLLGFLKGPDGVVKDWDGGTGPVPTL